MIADWGLDPQRQNQMLEVSGPYVDLAKIAVGISALLPVDTLARKFASYREHGITPFPGGQFLEHAVLVGKRDEYLQAICDVGFDCLEVSDNLLDVTLEQKRELIETARKQFGLRVLGEVGKKEDVVASNDLADDAQCCLDAGAENVFLEAADFFSGEVNETQLNRIIDRCGLAPLVFELPGPWIKGVTLSDVHQMTCWLVDRFGPDANIANVSPDDVLKVEALRLRIGVNAGKADEPAENA